MYKFIHTIYMCMCIRIYEHKRYVYALTHNTYIKTRYTYIYSQKHTIYTQNIYTYLYIHL